MLPAWHWFNSDACGGAMPSVQFGLFMPAESRDQRRRATYVTDLNRVLDIATGHFDSAWIVDHLQFADTDVLEGFTTLAYMAALHPHLTFGHAVLCQAFRNPALLAKMGSTLQLLSGGRFILGLGAGWNEEEYREPMATTFCLRLCELTSWRSR
jgi:alkanesulfonate monooxygenase SsuD/methylene tetrahydromethanopterin reductase-like flavin-dependent oxidoreductase (luciferase family)